MCVGSDNKFIIFITLSDPWFEILPSTHTYTPQAAEFIHRSASKILIQLHMKSIE